MEWANGNTYWNQGKVIKTIFQLELKCFTTSIRSSDPKESNKTWVNSEQRKFISGRTAIMGHSRYERTFWFLVPIPGMSQALPTALCLIYFWLNFFYKLTWSLFSGGGSFEWQRSTCNQWNEADLGRPWDPWRLDPATRSHRFGWNQPLPLQLSMQKEMHIEVSHGPYSHQTIQPYW